VLEVYTPYVQDKNEITKIPIIADKNYKRFVLYSLFIPNITPEMTLLIKTQFQVSGGPYKHYVGVGRHILRTDSPTETKQGFEVTEPCMSNLIKGNRNEVVIILGIDYNVPKGNYYYNVVVYAMAKNWPGETLLLPKKRGDCTAIVFD